MSYNSQIVYIYGLTDPNGNIGYVGQSMNPRIRYNDHLRDTVDTPKTRWIRDLLDTGQKPGLIILDKAEKGDANYVEQWWIVLGKQHGWPLTNSGKPTNRIPNFGGMFSEHLREEFEQFMIESEPVFLLTKGHIRQSIFAFRIILGLILGLIFGWSVYNFEIQIGHPFVVAIFYAFVAFVVTAYSGFFWAIDEFKRLGGKKLALLCISPLVFIGINVAIWVMGLGN